MTLLLSVLIIITCVLLIIIVLIQNPKGGGLSSTLGGGGNQFFGGVKKTTDFLDKGTWTLAIVLVVLVLSANVILSPQDNTVEEVPESEIRDEIGTGTPIVPQVPDFPQQDAAGSNDLSQDNEDDNP